MDPRRGLAQALALIALCLCACACVAARSGPGASSDTLTAQQWYHESLNYNYNPFEIPWNETETPVFVIYTANAISVEEAKPGKSVAATPTTAPAPAQTTEQTGTEGTEAAAQEAGNATARAPTTRLIERYPHAVLFGGTCGGTIISSKWILTAAHCTLFTSGRHVLAGTSRSLDGSGVSRAVKRLVVHPLFSVGPYWLDADKFGIKQVGARWDFLLVELEQPLPLDGRAVAAAQLSDEPRAPPGLAVGYAGYGAEHHGETMRSEMHGMELEIQPDAVCAAALEQFDGTDMICTRGRPPRLDSACNGDSGSGLVADGKLYGVASWVQDDASRCYNGALVVFSKVAAVRDWIRQVAKI